ncbi:sensor histidine kinase [Flavobacterium glaciei]|uniref:histidine kinase n=1 Tax=Flavobacterium glaciei TaxID=386300 RepID=A0A562Q5G4_9FLAO|nr:PAS domain-containing protein [Flavobacterium glaciei]RDI58186.1 PAS domain S-box-containing protein [Flavobacterium glaciei]TWI51973.1 PAS domain S-box-containing protein [Flavobacterium glaciei]
MEYDFPQNGNYQDLNNFYFKLFNEIPDLIFEFVIAPDNTYFFPLVSKSVTDFFELTSNHFVDSDKILVYERIFEADRLTFFQSLVNAKRNITRWDFEFRVILPKNGLRWLKVSSKPELYPDGNIAFYGRISDVTDLKDQEIKLKISEERFKFALEASTAGVWDWDLTTNKVFYSSQSMKILEQESMDIFDNPEFWDGIVHPDDLENYYSEIQNHFENKTTFYENYHRVLTSSGNYKWILDRGKVILRDYDGKPLRVIGTHTDISLQKEKELELVRTMELYIQQNSRLLNFSHIVSHNLNTQAGNIKSILDIIDYDQDIENSKEMLSHLRTVSNDLNETISNLTELVLIQSNLNIPIKSLNLNLYLIKTFELINNFQKLNKITIINEIPDDVYVDYNPAYLESVLLNFTTNAIKYSNPNKPVEIKYSFSLENGKKTLSISDNGLGIDLKKYGDSLFGMYKTFHKHEEARGLGLHITKNQIESMKGTVSVESEVGVGTTFKIVFNDSLNA